MLLILHFSFPKDEKQRGIWIAFVRLHLGPSWMLTIKTTRLCSDHFTPEDYLVGCALRVLKENVAPTIYNKENQQSQASNVS
jgi:hypothetical protein